MNTAVVVANATLRDLEFEILDGDIPLPLTGCTVAGRFLNVLGGAVTERAASVTNALGGIVVVSRNPDLFPVEAEVDVQFVITYPNARTLRVPEDGCYRFTVRRAL